MLSDTEKQALQDLYRLLAQRLPHFRPRAAQRQMLAEIAHTFAIAREPSTDSTAVTDKLNSGRHIAVIEGPTGVGKSLAYLLAGMVMALSRGKKLIVSSATIALQEQLVNRDLPTLIEHSELDVSYALAKGRGRYLCPYRLHQMTGQDTAAADSPFDRQFAMWDHKPLQGELSLLRLLAEQFQAQQWSGDRDDWPEVIDDRLWQKITNDRHGCLKSRCPQRPQCPFYLARDVLEKVDVVVTNHDLLLADASMGGGVVLPAPNQSLYCIDEAHHLAKKAVGQFAAEHSLLQAQSWLKKTTELLNRCVGFLPSAEPVLLTQDTMQALHDELSQLHAILQNEPRFTETDNPAPWLFEQGVLPDGLALVAGNMALMSASLMKQLTTCGEALLEARKQHPDDEVTIDHYSSELGMVMGQHERMAAVWQHMAQHVEPPTPPIAKWITQKREAKKVDFMISASPISAASALSQTLWQKVSAAVLTSATLRSLGRFDLLLQQTGLGWLDDVRCVALPSPFDFAQQGELYLPPMQANPRDSAAHTAEIISVLPTLIDTAEAVGSLVLFSSRRQMLDVAAGLPTPWRDLLLVQGELPKAVLLAQHQQRIATGQASVIFGLDSFAEGLDLPGEQCVHVIIAKLPFAMPDDPVGQTLAQWITARGGNPFLEISVPEASIKLVQAVGRLIRTERDYGRVSILDNRLLKQAYGRQLLAALPPFRRI